MSVEAAAGCQTSVAKVLPLRLDEHLVTGGVGFCLVSRSVVDDVAELDARW
ncbi:hypothetical protein IscW_ISCW022777 [Ixodes scapularis]|uniref:Uncharacterized protein n=1 Tax=Ixodes scapularis TaxID=6945 RepID=B7QCQ4_IXOSC|nr:hypothetical protein IscW_ISCW022777 [Ixodes scapularis]|eukprot:XP_002413318.1 hypothetical protein IscW_ISCW022777 [Ixodes scapularis]